MHDYACTPVVTGCGHLILAATIDYRVFIHLKRKLTCSEKAGVVGTWLLYHDRHFRQYYSERYNRDIHVPNLKN